jgi:hypothetical protein
LPISLGKAEIRGITRGRRIILKGSYNTADDEKSRENRFSRRELGAPVARATGSQDCLAYWQ